MIITDDHRIHELRDQVELEGGTAEGIDAAIRFEQDLRRFESVLDIVLGEHSEFLLRRLQRSRRPGQRYETKRTRPYSGGAPVKNFYMRDIDEVADLHTNTRRYSPPSLLPSM